MNKKAELINNRISSLRSLMKEYGIDMYLIGSQDFHGSEYVGEYFRCREYISGFTGSAGSVLVADDFAGLWTDGRYFIQAEKELEGTGITLFRSGEENVPELSEYIIDHLGDGDCLGFDGRTISARDGKKYEKKLVEKGTRIKSGYDLIGMIWDDRPDLPKGGAWLLDDVYSGESRSDRISRVRGKMQEAGADHHVITTLDDIAWILNIRGNDVRCNPVVLSYLIIDMDSLALYVMRDKFSVKDISSLTEAGVSLKPYNNFYEDLRNLKGRSVLVNTDKVNFYAACCLKGARLIDKAEPSLFMKAVKNETELKNIRNAHLLDGIALTRFMYWLKTHIGKEKITEISAAHKMDDFRMQMPGYIMPSFEPISAYGENAALPHYSASPDHDAVVEPRGFLLMDTGGQYKGEFRRSDLSGASCEKACENNTCRTDSSLALKDNACNAEDYQMQIEYACGTTDITRTFAVGPLTDEEKMYFTLVLKGHLRLAGARFKKGVRGVNLDYLAREPIWAIGKDFSHGTGHGVGYLLNVHESPNSFRYRTLSGRATDCVINEGMVTSDEPGIYFEGKFGIRHENLIECILDEKNEYGEFLRFEHLTLVPFDPDGIDETLLSDQEKKLLAKYQQRVYREVSPYLNDHERIWLKNICNV